MTLPSRAQANPAAQRPLPRKTDEGFDPDMIALEQLMARLCAGGRLDRAGVMANEHLATGGRRMRARLALTACTALGAPAEAAIPWAAAVELLHNATLIHDDIQDGDTHRRGEPTVWVRHGSAQAINAGDLLLMLPWLAIAEAPVDEALRFRLCRVTAERAQRTVRGQVDELDLFGGRRVDMASYARVIAAKTGHLLALPVEGAALLAGRSPTEAAQLARPFEALGLLYQLVDDVIDLYGDKGREAPGSDLREGKLSALVVHHLRLHPEDRAWLTSVLLAPREETDERDVQHAITRFREGGAVEATLAQIDELAARVHEAPELAAEPGLRALARMSLALVLAPLDPIRSR